MDGSIFVGGSAMAKKRARHGPRKSKQKEVDDAVVIKKRRTCILNNIPIVERFFTSLFSSSSYADFEKSNTNENMRNDILSKVCDSLNFPLPGPLPPIQTSKDEFYKTRAALVMEESRAILSNAIILNNKFGNKLGSSRYSNQNPATLTLNLLSAEKKKHGNLILFFEKSSSDGEGEDQFTPSELYAMRLGGCFALMPEAGYDEDLLLSSMNHHQEQQIWPIIAPCLLPNSSNGDYATAGTTFMCFQKELFTAIQSMPIGTKWLGRPLTTLITQLRQFEVCVKAPNVPFLPSLLGSHHQISGTHTRFNASESSDNEVEKGEEEEALHVSQDENEEKKDEENASVLKTSGFELKKSTTSFNLPTLNPTQQGVIDEFLYSPSSTLTLVQGPPGTGKSELIVSFLFQCLLESNNSNSNNNSYSNNHNKTNNYCYYNQNNGNNKTKRRIMVCAPTNKAVLAVTKRFHSIWKEDVCLNCILVGVEKELITSNTLDDSNVVADGISATEPSMRGFFLYTWMETFIKKTQNIHRDVVDGVYATCPQLLSNCLRPLTQQLHNSLPLNAKKSKSLQTGESVLNIAKELVTMFYEQSGSASTLYTALWHDLNVVFESFLVCLNDVNPFSAMQELVSTANVIFCTLATSGISLLKSKKIDDLVIDEAAAATEIECCLPFCHLPKRLLLVGDPLQLPATIFSPQAKRWGLEKSMHHRLMYDCNYRHTMLDVQYRMRPDISIFPSHRFYSSKIANGSNVISPSYKGDVAILDDSHYSFVHVEEGVEKANRFGSYDNQCEAAIVVQLVYKLRENFYRKHGGTNHRELISWHSPDRIRVITFYSGQVALIERLLAEANLSGVTVATVDSSQGSESDIVIVSFVRSTGVGQRHSVGFLADNRRLNVALTRARYQLICVGNVYGSLRLEQTGAIKDLIQNTIERGRVVQLDKQKD